MTLLLVGAFAGYLVILVRAYLPSAQRGLVALAAGATGAALATDSIREGVLLACGGAFLAVIATTWAEATISSVRVVDKRR